MICLLCIECKESTKKSQVLSPELIERWQKHKEKENSGKKKKVENKETVFAIGALIFVGCGFAGCAAMLNRLDFHANLDTYAAIQKSRLRGLRAIAETEANLSSSTSTTSSSTTLPPTVSKSLVRKKNNKVDTLMKLNKREELEVENVKETEEDEWMKKVEKVGFYLVGAAICVLAGEMVLRRLRK